MYCVSRVVVGKFYTDSILVWLATTPLSLPVEGRFWDTPHGAFPRSS
jgi:hypothetical protein